MLHIEYAKLTKTPEFAPKIDTESQRLIQIHAEQILQEYDILTFDLISKEKKYFGEYQERLDCWNEKVCAFCGGKLHFIPVYDGFWGCENYKTIKGNHTTFSGKEPVISWRMDMPSDILLYILKQLGLQKKIKHKPLYDFIMSTGREDLRLKYGFTSMQNTFNGRQVGKQRSLHQEKKAHEYLITKYNIVIPQQCITYKLFGEKERFCIPDFICSNANEVLIADAKLSFIDEAQLTRYIDLISFIMDKKGDKRYVKGAFIVYRSEFAPVNDSKYPLIEI